MTSASGGVRLDTDGHIAVITLERAAKLNAVTPEMTEALAGYVAAVNESRDLRVAILTGTGRAFCAGSDIAGLADYDSPWQFGGRPDYCDAVRGLRKPVIAAINGYAFGGGLELALTCDIRLAADTASFAAPEIKLGWIGGGGMSALLAHSIGPSNAALMLLTGDPVDAATALRWGLVTDIGDQARLDRRRRHVRAARAQHRPEQRRAHAAHRRPGGRCHRTPLGPGHRGPRRHRPAGAGAAAGRHHREPRADRGGNREAQPRRRVRHAARPRDRLRAAPADHLLRHGGRGGGPGGLRRAPGAKVPGTVKDSGICKRFQR